MQLYAPAKINLSFEIKGRREDGFHEIETLMAPISLSDRLTIERGQTRTASNFPATMPPCRPAEENLVVQAARLFQKATKIEAGVEDCLGEKNSARRRPGRRQQRRRDNVTRAERTFRDASRTEGAHGARRANWIRRSFSSFLGRRRPAGAVARLSSRQGCRRVSTLLLVKPDFGVPTPWAYERWKDSRNCREWTMRRRSFPACAL